MSKVNSTDNLFSWQFQAQNPATPVMEGIIALHNYVLMYLILVFVVVVWFLIRSVYLYFEEKKPIKPILFFDNQPIENTEDIWTIAPLFIVIAIYIPSMAFLYSMDDVIEPLLNGGALHKKLISGHSQNPSNQFLAYDLKPLELTEKPGCVTGTLNGVEVFAKSAKCKCLFAKSGHKVIAIPEIPEGMPTLFTKLSNLWSRIYLYFSGLYFAAKPSSINDPKIFAKANMQIKLLLNSRRMIDVANEENKFIYANNLFLRTSDYTIKFAAKKDFLRVEEYFLSPKNLSNIGDAVKKHSAIYGYKKPLNLTFAASNIFLKSHPMFSYTGVEPFHLGGASDEGFDMFGLRLDWVNAIDGKLFREYTGDLARVLSAKSSTKCIAEKLIDKNIQEFSREKQIYVLKKLGKDIGSLHIQELLNGTETGNAAFIEQLAKGKFTVFFDQKNHPSFKLLLAMSLDPNKTSEQITTELFAGKMDPKMLEAFTLIKRTGDLLSDNPEIKFSNALEVAVLVLSDNITLPMPTADLLVKAGVNKIILVEFPAVSRVGELVKYRDE